MSIISNQQPATSNQQPATSNQQPATSNQQPATSNQQPATSNQQPATSNPYKYLNIRNLLFFLAFLLTLSIIAYCKNNPTDSVDNSSSDTAVDNPTDTAVDNPSSDTAEFDPTCTNGTASTEKVSVENTENCASCATGYAPLSVGDFMECRAIPYICTNGTPEDGNAPNGNTENCARCTTTDYTKVPSASGDFQVCRTSYVCTNGNPKAGNALNSNTENCVSCLTGYTEVPSTSGSGFNVCEATPYICTNGAPVADNALNSNTENCMSCLDGYVLLPVSMMNAESFKECPLDTDGDLKPDNTFGDTEEDDDDDGDNVLDDNDVDADGDGLIEIRNLNDLATIRGDLDGNGDDDDSSDGVVALGKTGCGGLNSLTACTGYELMQDLDFADATHYANDNVNMDWRPTDGSGVAASADSAINAGWIPIGNSSNTFSTTFEGNGFTISNLYVRRSARVGFFGETSSSANIRNIGLVGGAVFGSSGIDYVGGLVGSNSGNIIASYATGKVFGSGQLDYVGGLVGGNDGNIIASYATGKVDGGGSADYIGGLVGFLSLGNIRVSYATGSVDGGGSDFGVGGLVGYNNGGNITASYATGSVAGSITYIGGLVGSDAGSITASYGFGSVAGTPPTGVTVLTLTKAIANTVNGVVGTSWDIAWDFGTTSQPPALRYADYDGTGSICAMFPVNIVCGTTLLPGPNETRPNP